MMSMTLLSVLPVLPVLTITFPELQNVMQLLPMVDVLYIPTRLSIVPSAKKLNILQF